jgi:Bacteriophage T4-like portal protein (Gp20)
MTWQKYFTVVPQAQLLTQRLEKANRENASYQATGGFGNKFSSFLPEVYSGSPNRMERYIQYDQMDQDSDVNAALDTVADFCTQKEEQNELPFHISYTDQTTDSEVSILQTTLRQWCELNQFGRRIWRIFRSTLKYGDQFFIRDPETLQWEWLDPNNVDGLTVNEMEGKKPLSYLVRNLDLNMQSLVGTSTTTGANYGGLTTGNPSLTSAAGRRGIPYTPSSFGGSSTKGGKVSSYMTYDVDAAHVVHLSLSEGIDPNWPFGNSILENIFKTYKQKELLEDSVIIYRVQRAPERRVFYIDVGNMPVHRAMAHLERVKNEIHQRRIPNRTGGGTAIQDAAYNPMAMLDDYFFASTSEGRGSKVETLPGGENLGQIDDLRFFQNKIFRGLRIPIAYIPTGPEEGTNVFTDGRVGTAYIQEFRFGVYCERLQSLIDWIFDKEFKLFVKLRGIEIESSLYKLKFNKPENFGKYRQIELDSAQLGLIQSLFDIPFLSKRYVMERYMDMNQEEMLRNERMWREENPNRIRAAGGELGSAGTGLGAVGIRSSGMPGAAGPGPEAGGELGGNEIPAGTELATTTPPPGTPPGGAGPGGNVPAGNVPGGGPI